MRVKSYFSWLVLKSHAAYRNIARACLVHMGVKLTCVISTQTCMRDVWVEMTFFV
jgi:hypothetical protein